MERVGNSGFLRNAVLLLVSREGIRRLLRLACGGNEESFLIAQGL
jgi:hypothetical protein